MRSSENRSVVAQGTPVGREVTCASAGSLGERAGGKRVGGTLGGTRHANKVPPWTIGGALFWALRDGLLFGQWSTLFCHFICDFPSKGGGLLFGPFWGGTGRTSIRAWNKQGGWTFIRGRGVPPPPPNVNEMFRPAHRKGGGGTPSHAFTMKDFLSTIGKKHAHTSGARPVAWKRSGRGSNS